MTHQDAEVDIPSSGDEKTYTVFTFHFSPAFDYCLKIQLQDRVCYGTLMQSRRDILSVIENSLYCIVYNTSNNMNKPFLCLFFLSFGTNWDPSSPPEKQAAAATVKSLDVCNA